MRNGEETQWFAVKKGRREDNWTNGVLSKVKAVQGSKNLGRRKDVRMVFGHELVTMATRGVQGYLTANRCMVVFFITCAYISISVRTSILGIHNKVHLRHTILCWQTTSLPRSYFAETRAPNEGRPLFSSSTIVAERSPRRLITDSISSASGF